MHDTNDVMIKIPAATLHVFEACRYTNTAPLFVSLTCPDWNTWLPIRMPVNNWNSVAANGDWSSCIRPVTKPASPSVMFKKGSQSEEDEKKEVAGNPSWCTCFYEWNWFSLCSEQHCPATSSTSHSINTSSLQPPPCTTIKTAVSETHKHALTLQALLHGRYLLCFSFPIGKAESQHFEYVWTMQAAYSLRDGRGCLSAMAKALFTGSGFLPSILSGERASLVQRTLL